MGLLASAEAAVEIARCFFPTTEEAERAELFDWIKERGFCMVVIIKKKNISRVGHNEHLLQEGRKLQILSSSCRRHGMPACLPPPGLFLHQVYPDRAQYHRLRLKVKSVQAQIPATASFHNVKTNQQNWLQWRNQ